MAEKVKDPKARRSSSSSSGDIIMKGIIADLIGHNPSVRWRGLIDKELYSEPFRNLWGYGVETKRRAEKEEDIKGEIKEVRKQVDELKYELDNVKLDVLTCKKIMNNIYEELCDKPILKETWLYEIDETMEVLQPIPIVIEELEEEVVASFPEIETYATGVNEAEAINNLKKSIAELYRDLMNDVDNELGKMPKIWKRVLGKLIKEI